MQRTTVAVSTRTRQRLRDLADYGETLDDVISWLLDQNDHTKHERIGAERVL